MQTKNAYRAGFAYPPELKEVVRDLADREELSKTVSRLLAREYGITLQPKTKRQEIKGHKKPYSRR